MDKQTVKEFFFPVVFLSIFAFFFAFSVFVFALILIINIFVAKNLGGKKRDTFLYARNQLAIGVAIAAVIALLLYVTAEFSAVPFAPKINELEVGLSVIMVLLPVIYWVAKDQIKPKKTLPEFENLVQERMYDKIDRGLSQAVANRVTKWHKGFDRGGNPIPARLTTKNLDLAVINPRGKILPHIEKEIHDIISAGPSIEKSVITTLYGYQLNQISKHIENEKAFIESLTPLYAFIWNVTVQNLKEASVKHEWHKFATWANGCTEYAILSFVEYGRNFKNIPPGNIKALAVSEQDFHFFGAFNSLNFVSVGRYGVAISTGYLLYKTKHPLPFL